MSITTYPFPDVLPPPTLTWHFALDAALELGAMHPDMPVRLQRSNAEMLYATCRRGPVTLSLLLLFDWPAGVPHSVTAASLADAIRSSHADDLGGLTLGTDALVAAAVPAPDHPELPFAHHLRQEMSGRRLHRWLDACHMLEHDAIAPGTLAFAAGRAGMPVEVMQCIAATVHGLQLFEGDGERVGVCRTDDAWMVVGDKVVVTLPD